MKVSAQATRGESSEAQQQRAHQRQQQQQAERLGRQPSQQQQQLRQGQQQLAQCLTLTRQGLNPLSLAAGAGRSSGLWSSAWPTAAPRSIKQGMDRGCIRLKVPLRNSSQLTNCHPFPPTHKPPACHQQKHILIGFNCPCCCCCCCCRRRQQGPGADSAPGDSQPAAEQPQHAQVQQQAQAQRVAAHRKHLEELVLSQEQDPAEVTPAQAKYKKEFRDARVVCLSTEIEQGNVEYKYRLTGCVTNENRRHQLVSEARGRVVMWGEASVRVPSVDKHVSRAVHVTEAAAAAVVLTCAMPCCAVACGVVVHCCAGDSDEVQAV